MLDMIAIMVQATDQYSHYVETEQIAMGVTPIDEPASTDPGKVLEPTSTSPVVPAPQGSEGVSQKEAPSSDDESWKTGPNPEGKVIEVPAAPTPPPPSSIPLPANPIGD